MRPILLILLLIMPITAFTQSEFHLPDGSSFRAYFDTPGEGIHPLVVIMGGGPGDERIAGSAFRNHGDGFIDRGWAVVAPVSPNGQSFWGDNGGKVRDLITVFKERNDIAGGPVLLMGVSNGGISALDIALRHPEEYLGIIAVPALASDSPQLRLLEGFPVFLRIGSEDRLGWGSRYEDTVRILERAGVNLDARLLQGIGHTFPLDWNELEPWLDAIALGD